MQNLYKYNIASCSATINLKVKAASRQDRIDGFVQIENQHYLKVHVKSVPEDGKANKSIIKLLSKLWRIAQADFEIIKGSTSSSKVLEIKNITEESLKLIFTPYITE